RALVQPSVGERGWIPEPERSRTLRLVSGAKVSRCVVGGRDISNSTRERHFMPNCTLHARSASPRVAELVESPHDGRRGCRLETPSRGGEVGGRSTLGSGLILFIWHHDQAATVRVWGPSTSPTCRPRPRPIPSFSPRRTV